MYIHNMCGKKANLFKWQRADYMHNFTFRSQTTLIIQQHGRNTEKVRTHDVHCSRSTLGNRFMHIHALRSSLWRTIWIQLQMSPPITCSLLAVTWLVQTQWRRLWRRRRWRHWVLFYGFEFVVLGEHGHGELALGVGRHSRRSARHGTRRAQEFLDAEVSDASVRRWDWTRWQWRQCVAIEDVVVAVQMQQVDDLAQVFLFVRAEAQRYSLVVLLHDLQRLAVHVCGDRAVP